MIFRYGLYAMTTLFPTEVRQDLRKGLRLKRKGEWDAAIQYLSRYASNPHPV
jgi:hypothetical protein